MWVKSNLCEGVVPVRDAKVHNHKPEVISEGISDEEPLAGEVLEPNLGFALWVSVDQSKSSIFDFSIDIKGPNVLAASVR